MSFFDSIDVGDLTVYPIPNVHATLVKWAYGKIQTLSLPRICYVPYLMCRQYRQVQNPLKFSNIVTNLSNSFTRHLLSYIGVADHVSLSKPLLLAYARLSHFLWLFSVRYYMHVYVSLSQNCILSFEMN